MNAPAPTLLLPTDEPCLVSGVYVTSCCDCRRVVVRDDLAPACPTCGLATPWRLQIALRWAPRPTAK